MPSRSEGLPLVAAEAALAGLPIVATNVGGLPEAVLDGETGFVVDPDSPALLATRILELLTNDGLRTRFAARAREQARRRFSPYEVAERYAGIYTRIRDSRLSPN